MSILIKGIDLPEAYTSAWLTVFECVGEHTFIKTHKVSAEQMQVIPPHGHLIDADIVCYQLEKQATIDGQPRAIRRARKIVADAPTIIEAEEGEEA